jgi:ADP-ribosylglycohydrolase
MLTNKVKDGIIGFVIGDAMGVPNEFKSRQHLKENLVTEMKGFGSHPVPAGSWSDDSSMLLATIDSIINKNEIDNKNIADNFVSWVKDAKYTPFNYVFDIGSTCLKAITTYKETGNNPAKCGLGKINDNSNGSLMRILPIAYYAYYKQLTDVEILKLVKDVSSITHKHEISILGCYIYVRYVICLLGGKSKEKSYNIIKKLDYSNFKEPSVMSYERILKHDISKLKLSEINSSEYIVDSQDLQQFSFPALLPHFLENERPSAVPVQIGLAFTVHRTGK